MRKFMLLPFAALSLVACGNTATPPAAPTINLNGTWVATLDGADVKGVFRFALTQSGNTLGGDAEAATSYINTYAPFGKVTGNVSGDQFTFSSNGNGQFGGSVTLSGTVVAGKLTGNWNGTNPQGATASGTYTATKQ